MDAQVEEPVVEKAEKKADSEKQGTVLGAHLNGKAIPLSEVQDEAFGCGALGDGAAIEPSEGKLYAPADGVIETVFDTKHAIGMTTDSGVELLLHIGIDTVKLGGKHFEAHVNAEQKVKKGDLLVTFDMEAIKKEGYLCTTPIVVCNTDDYKAIKQLAEGEIKAGQDILSVEG